MTAQPPVHIIGAGLAGCEAAYALARRGIKVNLYEMKPGKFSPAHGSADFAELVCSNSLKSDEVTNACGLLKEEMRRLGSLIIACADETRVPAGGALAVDRARFSARVTEKIRGEKNITVTLKEVCEPFPDGITVIAAGPLAGEGLQSYIAGLTGGGLYFFDAAAPIVYGNGIDMTRAFIGDRYGKGGGDYINCPLTRAEYEAFYDALVNAETAARKDFEINVFEGCMPVEVLAKRGFDALRYGPMKPVGLGLPGERAFAVLQLRKENVEGSAYNLVGFQTNLAFGEQRRVFSMVPALKNAEFAKYGVMHRNAYINAPKALGKNFRAAGRENLYFAGQISGVEGYAESAASGLVTGLDIYCRLSGREAPAFGSETMHGALLAYLGAENKNFQPMNANFAVIKPLGAEVRDKRKKYAAYAERALNSIEQICRKIENFI